jgi:hypothetical protein
MKYILIVLLLLTAPVASPAQQNVLYADAGISFAKITPGFSATFNYRALSWLGLGAGAQLYNFHATPINLQYVPTLYGDIHFNIFPKKKNQLLAFLDIGADIYQSNHSYWRRDIIEYTVPKDNGVYWGMGLGYFHRITKRGWGLYATAKLINNIYKANTYNLVTAARGTEGMSEGTAVLSVGWRF